MLQSIGWIATAIFAASYFCKRPAALRCVQAVAALLWIAYGVMIHAIPVIVANLIVAAVAVSSAVLRKDNGAGYRLISREE